MNSVYDPQVGSRTVILASGILMIFVGLFGKIGAIFTTIPTPVVGGMLLVMFGVISAAGVSNLQVFSSNQQDGKGAQRQMIFELGLCEYYLQHCSSVRGPPVSPGFCSPLAPCKYVDYLGVPKDLIGKQ